MELSYKEFKKTLIKDLSGLLGESVTVETANITVNNNSVIEGLQILDRETNMKPVFRLKRLFSIYRDGTSMKELEVGILQGYLELMQKRDVFEIQEDPDKAKKNLVARLVSAKDNRDRLKSAPWMPLLDLAVQLYYRITTPSGIEETLVQNEMFTGWHLTVDEAVAAAFENMMRMSPPIFAPINEMIDQLSEQNLEEETEGDQELPHSGVCLPYVLTNTERCYGAVWMADKTTLMFIARKLKDSFYILPSSVHECMILPVKQFDEPARLKQMVGKVNVTELLCIIIY